MDDKLKLALLETHQVELDPEDKVEFEHNYCEDTLVDVVVTDCYTGKQFTFEWFDTAKGIFLY
jgi:hypothetical protein